MFAGGDIVTGGATVILAMGAGRRAAKSIAAWLQSGKSKWPVTKADADAFVPGAPVGVRPEAAPQRRTGRRKRGPMIDSYDASAPRPAASGRSIFSAR